MARTPDMQLHPRGSGDPWRITLNAEINYISALGEGLLRELDPNTGKTMLSHTYHIPSLGVSINATEAQMLVPRLEGLPTHDMYAEAVKDVMTTTREAGRLAIAA